MIDILTANQGQDLGVLDTQAPRATNILSVQLGSLEYAPALGIDLDYFLSPDFNFQNATFKAYLIDVLATNGINVESVKETVLSLYSKYLINLKASENNTGMIAR